MALLDLSSTSPTDLCCPSPSKAPKCAYSAIFFACQLEGKNYSVLQGCCNHWDCPRCGQIRAKREYARMVCGIADLSKQGHEIYFHTITCRGKELATDEATAGYLEWTNRWLDAYRARVKRKGGHWCYVQVTERQKRGHPHSHILTTFQPGDLENGHVEKWRTIRGELQMEEVACLRSEFLLANCQRSGLGDQYDISKVRTEAAASRYVAKYLFKPSNFTSDWPKGWKRIRYSQNFPQLPEIKTDAFVLREWTDWQLLSEKAVRVRCTDEDTYEYTQWKLHGSDVLVSLRKHVS